VVGVSTSKFTPEARGALLERVVNPLGVVLVDELRRLWPTLDPTFLEDRRDVGIGEEALKPLLVPVEGHPDPGLVIGIAEDVRALAPVLPPLLGALCSEGAQEAVEILDLRRGQDQLRPPFVGCPPLIAPQYPTAEVVRLSASKFSPETRGALIERIATGVSLRDACRVLGLREKTVKSWLTRGRREGAGEYADFANAMEEAREAAKRRAEPMDADELARVVSKMARAGSVQAAKLRWEMLRSNPGKPAAAPVDEFDELKARRAARGS
jgi:hypothetical protein